MTRQREPREECPAFLAFVRRHRCCVCLVHPPVQAAHIRMAAPHLGKRATGMQEKPHDKWAVPLCDRCHLTGPEAQHKIGDEAKFWHMNGVDPFRVAADLWAEFVKVTPARSSKARKPARAKRRPPPIKRQKIPRRRNPWPAKGSRPLNGKRARR